MIKIKFLVIGSLKEKYFKDMQNEYLKRLQRYCDIEIKEFKEIPFDSNKLNTDLIESIKSKWNGRQFVAIHGTAVPCHSRLTLEEDCDRIWRGFCDFMR